MQRNCGVLAYDKLVGELNGRANEISMDTLAKLAQDNGFILYPLRVPVESMVDIPLPCVVYTQHHFQFMEDLAELPPVCMSRKFAYILSHELVNPDWVLDARSAKGIKGADIGQMFTPPKSKSPWEAMTSGSTGGWAGFAGPSTPTNPSDPSGWGWVGPALTAGAGLIPGIGPLLSAGMGAAGSMNNKTGYQGSDSGFGGNIMPTLMGGLGGYGMGGLGAGLGQGLKTGIQWGTANPLMGNPMGMGATQGGLSRGLSGFGQGFGQGVSNYFKPAATALNSLFGAGQGAAGSGLGGNWLGSGVGGTNALGAVPLAAGSAAGGIGAGGAGLTGALSGLLGGGGSGGVTLGGLGGMLDFGSQLMGLGQQRGGFEAELFSMPEYQRPPELAAYADKIGQAKTELGQMGQDELSRVLQAPIGSIVPDDNAYFDAMMRRTDEAATARKESITSNYNAIGRANSSEHIAEINKIDKELEIAKQDLSAVVANEKIKLEMDYKLSALSGALGIDQQAASELAGLTGLAVEEAALKYGIQVEQVMQLRQMSMLQELQSQLSSQQAGYAQDFLAQQGTQQQDLLNLAINAQGA